MNIVIDEAFESYLKDLYKDTYAALEENRICAGNRETFALWKDIVVGGEDRAEANAVNGWYM